MSSDYNVIKIDQASEADIKNQAQIIEGSTFQIPYSNWLEKNKVSDVYELPIEFCFFRKDNGRIRSEVLSHEKEHGPLNAKDETTQKLLMQFLKESDTKQNTELKKYLKDQGQVEPAVITADGFLINGNRRKMALQELYNETGDISFKKIKICILPGTGEPEQPTPFLISLLENRYQSRKEGKSEYSNMNKALTARLSLDNDVKLDSLLMDDPAFASSDPKEFIKNKELFESRYLKPLKLMDDYLEFNGIPGNYQVVKDRWDVFYEAQKYVVDKLENIDFLLERGFEEKDKAKLLQATFNIIKLNKKDSYTIEKRKAEIVRDVFRRYAKSDKKELLKLGSIDVGAQHGEDVLESYNEWQQHEGIQVLNSLKKLKNLSQRTSDKETPLDRLEEALQKLTNEKVWGENLKKTMSFQDAEKCKKITIEIQRAVKRLYNLFENFKDKEEAFKKYIKDLKDNK
jgi:hypothetical protein